MICQVPYLPVTAAPGERGGPPEVEVVPLDDADEARHLELVGELLQVQSGVAAAPAAAAAVAAAAAAPVAAVAASAAAGVRRRPLRGGDHAAAVAPAAAVDRHLGHPARGSNCTEVTLEYNARDESHFRKL